MDTKKETLYKDMHYVVANITNKQNKVYRYANAAMIVAYWEMGKHIIAERERTPRIGYQQKALKELSESLIVDFWSSLARECVSHDFN